jgi:hypothetical protein
MFDVTSKEGLEKRSIKVVKVEIDYHKVEVQLKDALRFFFAVILALS